MMRHSAFIFLAFIVRSAFGAQETVQSGVEGRAEDVIPEVVVEAPEPRFAIPTLRDRIGRIWAPVLIDGKGPFRLVLDTGASRSAVTAQLVERLGSSAQSAPAILVHGVTGSAVVPSIRVGQMEFGELLIKSSVLPIVPDVFGGADGILGKEGFADKRVLIDFSKDRVVIYRSHREPAAVGFSTVPLKVIGGLLVANVRIRGIAVKAVIDTGGQQTCGNLALRDALIRHPDPNQATDAIVGVTLDQQQGQTMRISSINFGDVEIHNTTVTLGDLDVFKQWRLTREPAMLIGMDVLGSVETLVIDYKLRQLQIRVRSRA